MNSFAVTLVSIMSNEMEERTSELSVKLKSNIDFGDGDEASWTFYAEEANFKRMSLH